MSFASEADLRALAMCVLEAAVKHRGSVTSWYRTAPHNRLVGGMPLSRHCDGAAMDVMWDPDDKGAPRWPPLVALQERAAMFGVRIIREERKMHDHFELFAALGVLKSGDKPAVV